jgi:hypothetical protein
MVVQSEVDKYFNQIFLANFREQEKPPDRDHSDQSDDRVEVVRFKCGFLRCGNATHRKFLSVYNNVLLVEMEVLVTKDIMSVSHPEYCNVPEL